MSAGKVRFASVCTAVITLSALLVAPGVAAAKAAAPDTRFPAVARSKAPTVRPSRPLPRAEVGVARLSAPTAGGAATLAAAATAVDPTAPVGPTQVTAQAQSISTISAQWPAASDPESGIESYVFAIGTTNTGTATALANVRWWQVTYSTNVSVNLSLDPNLTYYVSVQARNPGGLTGPIVTSNAIRPAWTPLGQTGNVVQLRLATTGLDTSGNATTGWTPAQVTQMTSFFNRMYPILESIYGPPADSYTVTAVRDLRYSSSNIFIPSLDEIHMDDAFIPQLFTHELVHAFRNDRLLSSDQNWNFSSTLSPFEEAFAQAVSYEAMNDYVAVYPNDPLAPASSLWGSSNDWDYDFQNVDELRGTDFWSEDGATGLHWLKYEMGAAALRKIELESANFYRRFNQEYYARINANPTVVRPTRLLIVDIIRTVVPQIEGRPAAEWVDSQDVLYAQNVYGKKIFHRIQDYPATDLFAFQDLYFLETMACGSEWACWDGQRWNYHRLNGSQGSGRLLNAAGAPVWSGNLQIQPTQNPSDGYFGIGFARKSLTTATTLLPWPGGSETDYVMNLRTFGLYRFESTFLDPTTQVATTNSIYRVMGADIANGFSGVWGGILGRSTGTLYLNHEGLADEPGIPVSNGAFKATRTWTGVPNPRTGGRDSVPGRVFATFVDAQSGLTYRAQRNVDWGSANGSQMFLFDFTTGGIDSAPPTVSVTSPANGATPTGSVTFSATATDNVGVARVQFLVDGTVIATDTSAPYSTSWNAGTATLGTHSLTARAYDQAGNSATTPPLSVTASDKTLPTVTITRPTNGSTVSRSSNVTISATAADNRKVDRVLFYVNNTLRCTDTTSSYSCTWPVPSARGVKYTIRVRAYDTSNNFAEKSVVVTSSR